MTMRRGSSSNWERKKRYQFTDGPDTGEDGLDRKEFERTGATDWMDRKGTPCPFTVS